MKNFSKILILSGLAIASSAFAQEGSAPMLKARVVSESLPRSTPMDIYITGANASVVQFKLTPEQSASQQMPLAQLKYFYLFEPEEFVSAMESYQNANYREAKAKFGKLKTKLTPIMGLPDGYFQIVALLELDSAIHLLDWEEVKNLSSTFPKQSPLAPQMALDMEINFLFAKLADKAYDEILAGAKKMLLHKDKLNLAQLSRIHYVLGLASAEKKMNNEALDHFASTIVGTHGGDEPLVASAIQKSLDILIHDPKLVEFMSLYPSSQVGNNAQKAPQPLKEAAALAYLYKKVLFPDLSLNPKYENLLAYYIPPSATAKKDTASATPAKNNPLPKATPEKK